MANNPEDLHQLETAYRCGHIPTEDFVKTREYLMSSASEVADTSPSDPDIWHVLAALTIGAVCCIGFGAWILQDLTLALTLTATLMAAVAVRALHKLEG